MGDRPNLMEDSSGMVFEYLDEQETEFLYEVMPSGWVVPKHSYEYVT